MVKRHGGMPSFCDGDDIVWLLQILLEVSHHPTMLAALLVVQTQISRSSYCILYCVYALVVMTTGRLTLMSVVVEGRSVHVL